MNIPNLISAARIFLVPLFVSYYLNGKVTAAMGVVLLAAASDVLDGAIARRFNMVTKLGKILDPVADKLMQAAMMLCAALETPAVWLLLGLHVLREAVLSMTGLHVILVTGQVHSAKWYGKLCTALIYACMGALLLFPRMPEHTASVLVLCCIVPVSACLVMYLGNFLRILREYDEGRSA